MADGFTAEGLDQLDSVIARHVGDDKVPGLAALVARGEQVHVQARGSLSIGGPPVARDSLFRIASTTKPIAAATAMALVEEGLIGLDDPVDELLPELASPRVLRTPGGPLDDTAPAVRPITARHLLTFTFGFGMFTEMFMSPTPWPVIAAANELPLGTLGPPAPDVQPDPDAWMAALGSLPLMAQPGERWMYNTGASVMGVLCARAAGQPIGEVMRTRLFEPIGMRDTAFWTAQTERLATSYRPAPDGLVVNDEPNGQWSHPPAFGDAAAGLVSTVDDLLAFARMLLRGGSPVLSAASARAMTSDQLTAEQKALGGFGPDYFVGQSWSFCQMVQDSGAFGWDGGLGTSWHVDPANDLTVIVLTQRMFDSPDLPSAHAAIRAAAYQALA
jgi:CubicO group peptidase (beta-lactamase class C family)